MVDTRNATTALANLTVELSGISGVFLKNLGKIMLNTDKKTRIQQFAELIGTDFSKRLNVIMVYMNLSDDNKKQIVNNIGNNLNKYALSSNNRSGGRKHKTKKNRRY